MNDQHGYDNEDLNEGMSARFAKTRTEADHWLFRTSRRFQPVIQISNPSGANP